MASPLNVVDSILIHTIFQAQSTFGAVNNASAGPTTPQPLSFTLNNVLYSVLWTSVFKTLTAPIEKLDYIT